MDDARLVEGEGSWKARTNTHYDLSLCKTFFGTHSQFLSLLAPPGPSGGKALEYIRKFRQVENGERMRCKSQDPAHAQPAPPPAHSSHSSQTFLAVGIGIGLGQVPQVKDATWAWAGFLVKAVAFPQAHPLLLTNPQAVREEFLQHRVSGSQVNSQRVRPEWSFHLSSGEPPSPMALGPASLFYALRPCPCLGTRSAPTGMCHRHESGL